MGLLKRIIHGKEEHIHFERDNSGRVTSVQRSGDVEQYSSPGETYTRGATPISDRLMASRPRKPSIREKAVNVAKRVDQSVVAYNRRQMSRPSRGRPYGTSYRTQGNYNPFGNMFDTGMGYRKPSHRKTSGSKTKYKVIGGKAYPIAGTGRKKTSKRKKSSIGLGGFDMTDNYGFMK